MAKYCISVTIVKNVQDAKQFDVDYQYILEAQKRGIQIL